MNYMAVVTSSSNSFFITTVKSDIVLTLTTIVGRIQKFYLVKSSLGTNINILFLHLLILSNRWLLFLLLLSTNNKCYL